MAQMVHLQQDPHASLADSEMIQVRLDYVDGLRAIAATWVVLHHAFETSVPQQLLAAPLIGRLVASLAFGQSPVMVFLVLSGFCLYYPLARKNPSAPTLNATYLGYMKRIAPPYLIIGALCIGLNLFPGVHVGPWEKTGPVTWQTVLSHLLFLHNLFPEHSVRIDYPMWSIGLEFQLYMLFPALVWLLVRMSPWLVLVGTVVLSGGEMVNRCGSEI